MTRLEGEKDIILLLTGEKSLKILVCSENIEKKGWKTLWDIKPDVSQLTCLQCSQHDTSTLSHIVLQCEHLVPPANSSTLCICDPGLCVFALSRFPCFSSRLLLPTSWSKESMYRLEGRLSRNPGKTWIRVRHVGQSITAASASRNYTRYFRLLQLLSVTVVIEVFASEC